LGASGFCTTANHSHLNAHVEDRIVPGNPLGSPGLPVAQVLGPGVAVRKPSIYEEFVKISFLL